MFERFDDPARAAVSGAHDLARKLGHDHIGTEHLLLALLETPSGAALATLSRAGVEASAVREALLIEVPAGAAPADGQLPFTPRAKKALELALREAVGTGSGRVLAEHLLFGLLAGDCTATRLLDHVGADRAAMRAALTARRPAPGPVLAEAHRRLRRARGDGETSMAEAGGFTVRPAQGVTELLMSAGAIALRHGRTEYTIDDVSAALRAREQPPETATG